MLFKELESSNDNKYHIYLRRFQLTFDNNLFGENPH